MAVSSSSPVTRWFAGIARGYHVTLEHSGALGILAWQVILSVVRMRVRYRDVLNQTYIMGIQSLPIVFVTASLAGIVTSQQGGYQLISSSPRYILGTLVVTSVVLELAPLLTAIVLVGRIGARITAELGTMVVSEQIDAFYSLGRDPVVLPETHETDTVVVLPQYRAPKPGKLTVQVIGSQVNFAETPIVAVDLAYDDGANNVHEIGALTLLPSAAVQPWTIDVKDVNQKQFSYSLTYYRADGSAQPLAPKTQEVPRIIVPRLA